MDTTIGTGQTSRSYTNTATRSNATGYVAKFVSPNLDMTSITAQTWTWNFAAQTNNTVLADFPTYSTNDRVPMCCYVWRPSTGAKVSNIFDGDASNTYRDIAGWDQTDERSEHGTFTGSAVTCQADDVIVMEMWCIIHTTSASSSTVTIYYDGTTVTSNSNTAVTNHASYLETPQTLTFSTGGGGTPIDMTQVAAKTYSNKFITKV